MAKDPAMLWYWGDWNSGTTLMSRFLKGCYIDLLHAQFNHGPLSIEEIKICLGSDFGQSWPAIQKKFKQIDGLFFNERLELEKEKRKSFTNSRKVNGSRGGRPKASGKPTGSHLPNLPEDENRNDNETLNGNSFGKSENLLLVPAMFEVFQKHNPKYPGSASKDYRPLYSIASYFCEIGKLDGSPDSHATKVIEVWEMVCKVIMADNFYKQKPLSTISNQIQELTQIALHGKSNSKNGSQGHTREGLQAEFERRYNPKG